MLDLTFWVRESLSTLFTPSTRGQNWGWTVQKPKTDADVKQWSLISSCVWRRCVCVSVWVWEGHHLHRFNSTGQEKI